MGKQYVQKRPTFIGYYFSKYTSYLLVLSLCVTLGMLWSCAKDDDEDGNPAAVPTLKLPASLVIPYEAEDTTVAIDASSGTWKVSSTESWLNFTPNAEKKTLRIQIEENTGASTRAADVNIVIEGFNVAGVLPVVQEVKPSLVITPSANVDVLEDAGETTLSVALSSGAWTAAVSTRSDWLSVQKSSADELKVKYSVYTDTGSRTGTIKVSVNGLSSVSQDITVTQSAPTKIVLSGSAVQNNAIEVSEASGAVTVNVQLVGPSGVEWSAVAEDDPDWVTITTNATAGTFTITYQQNDDRVYRVAVINVRAMPKAGDITQSLFIEQKGLITADPPELDFTKTSTWKFEIPSSAQTLNFSSTVDPSSFTASPAGAAVKGTHDASGNILPIDILKNSSVARTITVTMTEGSHTIVLQLLQASPVSIRVLGEDVSEGVITIEKDAVTDRDFDVEVIGATTWTVASHEGTWLTPAPANNNGQLRISAEASTERVYRTGSITIEAGGVTQEIRVEQRGDIASTSALPTLDFTMPGTIQIDVSAEAQTLEFPSTVNPSFSAVPRAAASKGNFNGTVLPIEINENGTTSRTIEVTLLSTNVIRIILEQEAKITIELAEASEDNVITLDQTAVATDFAVVVEGTEEDWTVDLTNAGTGSWLAATRSGDDLQLTTATANPDRGYRRDAVVTIEAGEASKVFIVEQKGLLTSTTYPQLNFASDNTVKMEAAAEMQAIDFPATHDPSAGSFNVNPIGAATAGTYNGSGNTFTITLQANPNTVSRTVEIELNANSNTVTLLVIQDQAVGIEIDGVEDVIVLAQAMGMQDFDVIVGGTTSTWSVTAGSVMSGGGTAWLSVTKETSGKLRLSTLSDNAVREYRIDGSFTLEVGGVEETFRVEQRGDLTVTPAALSFPGADGERSTVKLAAGAAEQTFALDGFTTGTGFQTGSSTVADPFSLGDPPQATTILTLILAENPSGDPRTVRAVLANNTGSIASSIELIVEQEGTVMFSVAGAEENVITLDNGALSQDFTLNVTGPGTTGATFAVTDPTSGGSADWLAATLQGSNQVRLVVGTANASRAFLFSSFMVEATVSGTTIGTLTVEVEQKGDMTAALPNLDFAGVDNIKIEATSAAQILNFPATADLSAAATVTPKSVRLVEDASTPDEGLPTAEVPQTRTSGELPITIIGNLETEERIITIDMVTSSGSLTLEIVQHKVVTISLVGKTDNLIALDSISGSTVEYEVDVQGTTDSWNVTSTGDSRIGDFFTATKTPAGLLHIESSSANTVQAYREGSITISAGGMSRTLPVEQIGNFNLEGDLPVLDFRTGNTVKIGLLTLNQPERIFPTVGLGSVRPDISTGEILRLRSTDFTNPPNLALIFDTYHDDSHFSVFMVHEGRTVTINIDVISTDATIDILLDGARADDDIVRISSEDGEHRLKVQVVGSDQDWVVTRVNPSTEGNFILSGEKDGDELVLTVAPNTERERRYLGVIDLYTVFVDRQTGQGRGFFRIEQEGDITANPANLAATGADVSTVIRATAGAQTLVFGGATAASTVGITPNTAATGTHNTGANTVDLELTANPEYTEREIKVTVTVGTTLNQITIYQDPKVDATIGEVASDETILVPQAGLTSDARLVSVGGASDWDFEVPGGSWLSVTRQGYELVFSAPANANRAYRTTTLTIIAGRARIEFAVEQAGDFSAALPTLSFSEDNTVKIGVPTGARQELEFTGVTTAPTYSGEMPSSSDISGAHASTTLTISLSENSNTERTLSIELTATNTVTLEIVQEPGVTVTIQGAVAQEGGNDLVTLANATTADARTVTVSGATLHSTSPIDSPPAFVSITETSGTITFTPGGVLTSREYSTGTFVVQVVAANAAAQAAAADYYQKTFDVEQRGDVSVTPADLDFGTASTIKISMPNGDAGDVIFGGVAAAPTAGTVDPAAAATQSWTDPNLTISVSENTTGEERIITFPFTGTGSSKTEVITLVIAQPAIAITVAEANAEGVIEVAASAIAQDVTVSFTGTAAATMWSIADPTTPSWITSADQLTAASGSAMALVLVANTTTILYQTQEIVVTVGGAMKTFILEQAGYPTASKTISLGETPFNTGENSLKIAVPAAQTDVTLTFTASLSGASQPIFNSVDSEVTSTAGYQSAGTFVLSVAENTGNARELTAVIADTNTSQKRLTVTIVQAAP